MSTKLVQITERARKYRNEGLTNLHQYIDEDMLKDSFMSLNKQSSAGVDGKYWHYYSIESNYRFPDLLAEFKTGRY